MHSSKPRRRVAAPLIACVVFLLAGAFVLHHFRRVKAVTAGDRVPALAMTGLNGGPVTLRPLTRGVTVYNIFATWCPSCREEMPALSRAARMLRARGIQVIGIDQDESAGSIEAFVAHFGISYPIVVDTGHVSNAVLGARVIPQTVVVKDGIVKAIAVGPITTRALEHMIGTV